MANFILLTLLLLESHRCHRVDHARLTGLAGRLHQLLAKLDLRIVLPRRRVLGRLLLTQALAHGVLDARDGRQVLVVLSRARLRVTLRQEHSR